MKREHSFANPQTEGLAGRWAQFWFGPTDVFGLHVVRLLTGLLLLAWLLPLAGEANNFFGLSGWFDRQGYLDASRIPGGAPKPIGWSLLYLFGGSPSALAWAFWGSIGVLVLFTLGVATRVTAVLTWVIVVSFTANPAVDDELDPLLNLLSVYLMVGYLLLGQWGGNLSIAGRLLGSWPGFLPGGDRRPAPPSHAATLALRLIQVHVAILVTTTGLHKLQSGDWWAGVAHWYLLHRPMDTTLSQLKSLTETGRSYLGYLNVAAYATLGWQIGFSFFAWRAGWWRVLLLGGAVIGWIGTSRIYEMALFGPALLIGCLSYIRAREWQVLGDALRGIGSLKRWLAWLPTEEELPYYQRASSETAVAVKGR